MSNVFVTQAGPLPNDLLRLVCAYFGWNGLRVSSSADWPRDQAEGAVLDLIGRSDVFVVLQTHESKCEEWLVRQLAHAEATKSKIVRVAVSDGQQPTGGESDVALHSVEPGESALRSLLSVTVSASLSLDLDLSGFTVSSAEWWTLVDGVVAATGIAEWTDRGFPAWTRSADKDVRWDGQALLGLCDELPNPADRSVVRSAVVTGLLRRLRRNQDGIGAPADVRPLWTFIRAALSEPDVARRATVSSQGFYCVPLFSVVRHGRIEELLRLHVWPGTIDNEAAGGTGVSTYPFSVHSHQPHATSWVLSGGLRNRVYRVREWPVGASDSHSLFSVSWDGRRSYSLGHRQSSLRNTGVPVSVILDHEARFQAGHSYVVPTGEYHETEQMDDLPTPTATLFYFDATIGWRKDAGVVGPPSLAPVAAKAKDSVEVAPLVREVDAVIGHP